MRWHPLRQEWVAYATNRQNRTYKPPPEYCPLCPVKEGAFPGEIPFETFDVAVFENRFPSFHLDAVAAPSLPVETKPGVGRCEVVIYSPEHVGSLATIAQDRRELLIHAWSDRLTDLLSRPEIDFVLPFENRGEAVGATLHHPHGQIYALGFRPPIIDTLATSFRKAPVLSQLRDAIGDRYDVVTGAHTAAFVPPFARFPFEIWVAPLSQHAGPWSLSNDEISDLASVLGGVVETYDALFEQQMPYFMHLMSAPKGEEETFHFHFQFLPLQRSADKLKYLAAMEQGTGVFLADVAPEEMVDRLRAAARPGRG
ncbi:MAG: galactose-1-phosphate uridylyltransferase [Pseudomonadota bacterium]